MRSTDPSGWAKGLFSEDSGGGALDLATIYRQFLTEAIQVSKVVAAIRERRLVKIFYAGDGKVIGGYRTIEPYVYGVSKAGNPVLRAWQTGGVSSTPAGTYKGMSGIDPLSKMPGWRMFRLDRIASWNNIAAGTGSDGKAMYRTFDASAGFISANRPGYNPSDSGMPSIISALSPSAAPQPADAPQPGSQPVIGESAFPGAVYSTFHIRSFFKEPEQ